MKRWEKSINIGKRKREVLTVCCSNVAAAWERAFPKWFSEDCFRYITTNLVHISVGRDATVTTLENLFRLTSSVLYFLVIVSRIRSRLMLPSSRSCPPTDINDRGDSIRCNGQYYTRVERINEPAPSRMGFSWRCVARTRSIIGVHRCTDCRATIYGGISDPLTISSAVTYATRHLWYRCFRAVGNETKLSRSVNARNRSKVLENWFSPLDKCTSLRGTFISHIVKIPLTHRWRFARPTAICLRANGVSEAIPSSPVRPRRGRQTGFHSKLKAFKLSTRGIIYGCITCFRRNELFHKSRQAEIRSRRSHVGR